MGQCVSQVLTDDVPERYKPAWQPHGLGEGLGAAGGGFRMGAPPAPAAPAYTTTANVGLGRGEERRVFLPAQDPSPGALPRIDEDQSVQGQESPPKSQLSAASVATGAAPPPMRPLNWTRGELIGQGAFGSVYLGMDNDTGQLMAVKQVAISKAAERGKVSEHITGLEAEVHLLQQLNHPNIVRYLGTERSDTSLNIFLEYVPGGSIASLLAKFGSFRESVIKVYTKQILLGLEYLHKNGIMHRDIKGANILVDNTGLVKLADFGASKQIEDLATIESGFKSVKGTPYWMAPEVIKQSGHGRQADIWSVACTVIEMATGKPPWSEFGSQVAAMFHIASAKGPPTIPESLSADCKDFLYLCFNRSWKERPSATQMLQHPFLSEVVCRTVAAPLNNIANVVVSQQEPAIKAWRMPKSVRVPSPMRDEVEGGQFSTPSPLHPLRQKERLAGAGAAGPTRISVATSSQGPSDGELTPGAEAALSPLGHHQQRRRQAAATGAGAGQAQPRTPAGSQQPGQQPMQRQQQRGSPTKSQRSSVRASAPVFGGYAAAMGLSSLAPLAPLEPRARGPSVGSSVASTVLPRGEPSQLQAAAATAGTVAAAKGAERQSREGSLGGGADATLRLSSGSLRLSREQSGAGLSTLPSGQLSTLPSSVMAETPDALRRSLRQLEDEVLLGLPAGPGPAQPPLTTPAPARRGPPEDLIAFPDSAGRPGAARPRAAEASTPSTDEKSDYNPMEEPSWMQQSESPVNGAPLAPADAGQRPSRLGTQQEPASAQLAEAAPPEHQPQPPQQQQPEQQHMVWMDDDGSVDALPWDVGSWDVNSGEVSPAGGAAGGGSVPPPPAQAASPGEPVGQDVLISALNRRAQLEVRASLALFESTLRTMSLNVPSPKGGAKAGAQLVPQPLGAVMAAAGAGAAVAAAALHQQQHHSLAEGPMAKAAAKMAAAAAGGSPVKQPAHGAVEEEAPLYSAREAVWEQELSRELSQFGQLPSHSGAPWRYTTGGRRVSMHGSPMKAAQQQQH